MVTFSMRLPNMESFTLKLKSIPIRDWQEAWPRVINTLSGIMRDQFLAQGAHGPQGPWKPLAVKGERGPNGPYKTHYAERKQRAHPGAPILQASGALLRSLVSETGDTIDEREPMKMRWGTRLSYAAFLQTGTRKMFARPIFDLRVPEEHKALGRELMAGATQILTRAGYKVYGGGATPGEARGEGRRFFKPLPSVPSTVGHPLIGQASPLSGAI